MHDIVVEEVAHFLGMDGRGRPGRLRAAGVAGYGSAARGSATTGGSEIAFGKTIKVAAAINGPWAPAA